MATFELVLPPSRAAPSRVHLRPGGGNELGLTAGAWALTAAVLAGLAGSVVTGVALAYGIVALPWSRAFAIGIVGGASAGIVVGAVLGLVLRPRLTTKRS
ncbi:MAG: hypothetical protein IAG13_04095 [Deltaproteobacteria bacterium]|nr:hypothetical protein [Nannocystaceae bacterium]